MATHPDRQPFYRFQSLVPVGVSVHASVDITVVVTVDITVGVTVDANYRRLRRSEGGDPSRSSTVFTGFNH